MRSFHIKVDPLIELIQNKTLIMNHFIMQKDIHYRQYHHRNNKTRFTQVNRLMDGWNV